VLVVRSLTKTWGLAGLRAGYVLGDAQVIERLAAAQPHWPVSAPALAACVACVSPRAAEESTRWSASLHDMRAYLLDRIVDLVDVVPGAQASFVLAHTVRPRIWEPLRDKGFAVRRGDTFPGLDEHWIRIAVRDEPIADAFALALKECLA
jgi:histidinol-phosphate/aromatic aminotransferase/cobyric acid decarboxylase-like protein